MFLRPYLILWGGVLGFTVLLLSLGKASLIEVILSIGAVAAGAAYAYRRERTRHLHFEKILHGFQNLLNEHFRGLFKEITGEEELKAALEILEETPIEKMGQDFWQRLEASRSLVNKQRNVFTEKNRQIRDLNERILLSKQQLEAVFDVLNDGICIIDRQGRIFRLNRAYARFCGRDLLELLGKNSHEHFPGIEAIPAKELVARTFKTGVAVPRVKLETGAGESRRFFEYGTFPIVKGGHVAFVVEHFRDVSGEKRMNDQLIRSANLASIGTMITGIAHEINNPLSGISGCATNMLGMAANYGLNAKGQERVKDILECANRAEFILKDLLDLARKKEPQNIITHLVPILEKSMQSIHIEGYSRVERNLKVSPGLNPIIKCDPARVTQVFINLLSNATYAVLDRLERERTASGGGPAYQPQIHLWVDGDAGHLRVRVEDNGVGIPAEKLPHIFDPFYTTRPPGQGTGMGLTVCNKIMLEHEGRLYAESENGRTCFSAEFPVHQERT